MPTSRPCSVLVVSADRAAVEDAVSLLALHGFQATGAIGGAEAIDRAATNPPDVAVIDLSSPGLDGIALAARLRECSPATPPMLIAITLDSSEWDRERASCAGFIVRLSKPVRPAELVTTVRQCERARAELHARPRSPRPDGV